MLSVLGAGSLQFGSDCFLPCSGAEVRQRMHWVADLMDQLALGEGDRRQIWSGTAAAWLALAPPLAAPRLSFAALVSRASEAPDRFEARAGRWRPVCC